MPLSQTTWIMSQIPRRGYFREVLSPPIEFTRLPVARIPRRRVGCRFAHDDYQQFSSIRRHCSGSIATGGVPGRET
jgi:hypothetical protein